MRTIGYAFSERGSDKKNNFLLIRLLAASLVIYGHAFAFSATDGTKEFFSHFLGYMYAGDVGVNIFFVVSGFLVTASFCHRQNLQEFAIARLVRIYPALIVFLGVVSLVFGPLFTNLSPVDYFSDKSFRSFIFYGLTLRKYFGELPVEFSGSGYPNIVAGVLWTIVIEVRLYILIGILGVVGILRNRLLATVALFTLALVPVVYGLNRLLIYSNPDNARLTILFCVGALLYVNRNSVPLHPIFLAALIIATSFSDGPIYFYLFTTSLIYGLFCLAFAPKIKLPIWLHDYSYGIYLYGWIVQQLVHYYLPEMRAYAVFVISLPLATVCAALSWFLVEKPCLALKRSKASMQAVPHNADAALQ
ncbi:acyltransferase [Brucella sp. 458]|uniref:acyltransferase family protein n=1 Tax=Brucella sp. 458 TaxID=2821140 RepID=UPI001AE0DA8B|nr:acyltransferase [Brucella sp. 458]QTN99310.1 acyltransferase [Brucella sp. 458]